MNLAKSRPADPWAFFDRIYCISLASRPDRLAQAKHQFAAVGLLPRVEFVIVAKHRANPEEGIFESHLSCLRRGLAAGGRHLLIFEDDVIFKGYDPVSLAAACRQLQELPTWRTFFLGGITDGSRRLGKGSLARISYRCLAHAYAVNRSLAEWLAGQAWVGVPFDELLRRHQGEAYALYPMCAFQGQAGSDNRTVVIDRVRRLLGGLPFIQKMNELYQNHKAVLLPASLTALLGLAMLVFGWR